jgi:hypothetical protein
MMDQPRFWFVVMFLLGFCAALLAQPDTFSLTGHIKCTDQECEEGYFEIAPTVMLVVRPQSEFHKYLVRQKDRAIELTFALGGEEGN